MEFVVLGTGDAFSRSRAGASAVVLSPTGLVLVDAPDGLLRALSEASRTSGQALDPMQIDDILLTHLHGDHVNGLEAFGFLRWVERQRSGGSRPRLHTHASAAARLWERLAPAMDQGGNATLADYFDVRVLPEGGTSDVAGLSVRHRLGVHPVPSCGFLLSDGTRTLGWSGDTAWDPAHVEWLAQADFVVHETSGGPTHTPIERLNSLAPAVRTRMALIHMPDGFDPACTPIRLLRDGELVRF